MEGPLFTGDVYTKGQWVVDGQPDTMIQYQLSAPGCECQSIFTDVCMQASTPRPIRPL